MAEPREPVGPGGPDPSAPSPVEAEAEVGPFESPMASAGSADPSERAALTEPADPGKAKPTARTAALVSARMVLGALGVVVAAGTIAAVTLLPLPSVSEQPPSELVDPVATAQQLLCPGAFLRLADETGQGATTSSPVGRATVERDATTGTVQATPLAQSDASGSGGTASAPTVLESPPNEADPNAAVLVGGAQSQEIQGTEFAGLAAATCAVASGDSWLVGGSTAVGRTTLLTLSNPTEVTATVDLELFGENGKVSAPGTNGIDVPPNGQRVLSIAGFAPGLKSPVVHVTSRGGRVVANLQQSIVRGIDPGGIDIVGHSTDPSTAVHIPGIVMTDHIGVEQLFSAEGSEDILTTVRMFVPGDQDATATVNLAPEAGAGTGASFQVTVPAGSVSDFPIAELENGRYTLTIETDVPFVAAARVTSVGDNGTDFAWISSAPRLTGDTLFATPQHGMPALQLSNPASADLSVFLSGNGAPDVEVLVPAGSSTTAKLQPGASYLASGFDSLFATVVILDAGFIASYSVHPPGLASTPIRVYP